MNHQVQIMREFNDTFKRIEAIFSNYNTLLNDNLAYFEKILDNFLGIDSHFLDNFKTSDKNFELHSHPVGKTIYGINNGIKEIVKLLKHTTIPYFIKLINSVASNKDKYKSEVESLKNEINSVLEKSQKKSSLEIVKIDCYSFDDLNFNVYENNKNLHSLNVELHKEIRKIEDRLTSLLNEMDKFIRDAYRKEHDLLFETAVKFHKEFPYHEKPIDNQDRHSENEYISFYQGEFKGTFQKLYSILSIPQHSTQGINAVWKNDISMIYARVWRDFTPNNPEEVAVYKKEIVKVLEGGIVSHWKVELNSGEIGYVPQNILEPVVE